MSLSTHSPQQATRVLKDIGFVESKLLSPQAKRGGSKIQVDTHITSSPKGAQPDSGFLEHADGDLDFVLDESLPSHGNSNEDWILFANEDVIRSDGYYLVEEEGVDIASVKARHGSISSGSSQQHESFSLTMSYDGGRFHLKVDGDTPRRPESPTHTFTDHSRTQPCVTTLQQWLYTHEQHEELAWFFEQPPHSPFRTQQQSHHAWNEDIDLTLYDIGS